MKIDAREIDRLAETLPVIKASQVAAVAVLVIGHDGSVLAAKRENVWSRREPGTTKAGKPYAGAYKMDIGSRFGGPPLFATADNRMATIVAGVLLKDTTAKPMPSGAGVDPDCVPSD